ncbi:MAG: UDP-glucose/GDP-mannose dehydrogenase family protein [Actinomycetota bacterium]
MAAVAVGLSALGHDVWVTDLAPSSVSQLASGHAPVQEPGLDALLAQQIAAGRLHAVPPTDAQLGSVEFSVLAADVEVDEDDVASLEGLDALVEHLCAVAAAATVLVVMSQVPVGTSHRVASRIGQARGACQPVACMPENLRLGGALEVFFHPDRLIIGADDPQVAARVCELFAAIDCPKMVMGVASAEMSKHAMNAYLATLISTMSQLSDVCEAVGADAWDVATALRSDGRVSPRAPIGPGLGFAGGTLGRDLQYLVAVSHDHGVSPDLFEAVLEVNRRRLETTVARVQGLLETAGGRVGLLGLTYKPGTSTLRRSQSVELGRRLAASGAEVTAHDPMVGAQMAGELGFAVVGDAYQAAEGADVVVLMTCWPEYRDLDLGLLAGGMRRPVVFDPGGFLDSVQLAAAGFQRCTVGRP